MSGKIRVLPLKEHLYTKGIIYNLGAYKSKRAYGYTINVIGQ